MKSVYNRIWACLVFSLLPGISLGASAEIDRALIFYCEIMILMVTWK